MVFFSRIQQLTFPLVSKAVVCQSTYDRLIGAGRLLSFRVMSAIPQSCQAILTALYRDPALYQDTALLGDPYRIVGPHLLWSSEMQSLFFFLFVVYTLLLSSFWTSRGHRCRPFSPHVLAFNFYRAEGSAIPLLVDFSSSVAHSRPRAFRKSICAQEQVPLF